MLICPILLAAAAAFAQKRTDASAELLVGAITSIGTLALTLLFLHWDRLNPPNIGASPDRRTPLRFLAGVVVGLTLVTLWAGLWAMTGHMRWLPLPGAGRGAIALQSSAFLFLATREELAFHGYPLRRIQQSLGLWPAQLLVAAVFVAEHRLGGMTWAHAILGAGTGSILFGMAAVSSRGLALPIGIHSAWNLGYWALGMNSNTGTDVFWRASIEPGFERRSETAATIAYIAVFGAATLVLWLWHWKQAQGTQAVAAR